MKRFIAVIAALAAAAPAVAQTQADMNRDAATAYTKADAVMTREWKASYAYMKQRDAANTSRGGGFGYAAALLNSQRAWLKFQDAQCVIASSEFAGGSMQPMAKSNCLAGLTSERAKQLKSLRWQR